MIGTVLRPCPRTLGMHLVCCCCIGALIKCSAVVCAEGLPPESTFEVKEICLNGFYSSIGKSIQFPECFCEKFRNVYKKEIQHIIK